MDDGGFPQQLGVISMPRTEAKIKGAPKGRHTANPVVDRCKTLKQNIRLVAGSSVARFGRAHNRPRPRDVRHCTKEPKGGSWSSAGISRSFRLTPRSSYLVKYPGLPRLYALCEMLGVPGGNHSRQRPETGTGRLRAVNGYVEGTLCPRSMPTPQTQPGRWKERRLTGRIFRAEVSRATPGLTSPTTRVLIGASGSIGQPWYGPIKSH
jgi:hypothetical protein